MVVALEVYGDGGERQAARDHRDRRATRDERAFSGPFSTFLTLTTMAPKKKTTKNMRQTTLTGIVSSSPPRPEPKAKKVKGSSRQTHTASQQKRERTDKDIGYETESEQDEIKFEKRRKEAEV